eukprot:TRINITY_DN8126_c0_g1_i3.p1 TRINITY_DN8126_c0_g1~~TRINITY_DN8126_c0_g1_i3.p1  ORF type:complete len:296 (-),score=79.59 TRINITY_DN8126_c0_g1_i3:232-1119(-)
MEKNVETFMSVTGATRSQALDKLQVHGGDLNAAIDSFFDEAERDLSNSDNRDVPHANQSSETEHRGCPHSQRSSAFMDHVWSPFSAFDVLSRRFFDRSSIFDTSSNRGPLGNTRSVSIDWRDGQQRGHVVESRVGRNPMSNVEPHVSHPRDVRKIDIEWKDTESKASRPSHEPIIEEIPEEEHEGYEPGLEGNVTVVDDDNPHIGSTSPEDTEFQEKHHRNVMSSTPIITEVQDTSLSVVDDLDEELLKAAIEESRKEAEANRKKQHGLNDSLVSEADKSDQRFNSERHDERPSS